MKRHQFSFSCMASPCQIHLYAEDAALAKRVAQLAIDDVRRIEAKYSRYKDDSELSRINRLAKYAHNKIEVDEETAGLLEYADTCYHQSGGLFDITSGALRRCWNPKSERLPDQTELDELRASIGWEKVEWESPSILFSVPDMEIDFGGIGKEYASDRAAGICSAEGIKGGFVDLGGDIKIIGPHPDGSPWRIGIQHPLDKQALMGTIEVHQGGIASSGDYERFIEIEGQRYSHILSPLTGYPVTGFAGVTVFADACVIAGSAATISMLKESEGADWLDELGLSHLWMDQIGVAGGDLKISETNPPELLMKA